MGIYALCYAEDWVLPTLGKREDLEEAIEKGRYAVADTREEHEDYAARLNSFGNETRSLV
tara:strand:+ start:4494 stop:4673 length:180 start_codon:yes stop_codon:yes gene_type:complete